MRLQTANRERIALRQGVAKSVDVALVLIVTIAEDYDVVQKICDSGAIMRNFGHILLEAGSCGTHPERNPVQLLEAVRSARPFDLIQGPIQYDLPVAFI